MATSLQPQYRVHGQNTWNNFGSTLAATATAVTVTGLATATSYDFQVVTNTDVGQALSSVYTVSTQSTLSESAEATVVTTAGPIIYASQTMRQASTGPFFQFSLVTAAAPNNPFQISKDGVISGAAVQNLTYHQHTAFQYANWGAGDGWWYWNTSTSDATAGTPGWCLFTIGSVSLSTTSYTQGLTAGQTVATISATMSTNVPADTFSTFTGGTFTVNDTTNFAISGNNLVVAAGKTLGAGPYPVTITASFPVGGQNIGVTSINPTNTLTTSLTTAAAFPNNKPAQVPAGWTLKFFDDFTTNTVQPLAGQVSLTAGKNWYPGEASAHNNLVDPTNYHVATTTLASQISNGNSGGGANASPNGGILTVYGSNNALQEQTLNSVPQSFIASGSTYSGTGVYGPVMYIEGYLQRRSRTSQHMNFWMTSTNWTDCTEIDVVEVGTSVFGTNYYIGNLNEHVGGVIVAPSPYNTAILSDTDSNWHTFGLLIQATSGGQGTINAYMDNVQVGAVNTLIGAGTPWAQALLRTQLISIGNDLSTEPFNVDWVKVWGP